MTKKFTPTVTAWEEALRDALVKQAKTGSEGLTKVEIAKALKCGVEKASKLMRQLKADGRLVHGKRTKTVTALNDNVMTVHQDVYSIQPRKEKM